VNSLRLGYLAINSSLTARTLQTQAMFYKTCWQQFGEVSWHPHSDSFTLTPLTGKKTLFSVDSHNSPSPLLKFTVLFFRLSIN
jgi:hypothetical protein